ncbi:endonuclease/exonuclease/phosphatase family protein [Conservatibacter flavescens]|uniref:Endonuclease/exonuclease/phosphatase domain-containing protein n=1 Tax=Conservatibacter flavescens TaxID=28161 RepID=A0A2M8S235_9PAST|nr:endonuclease/exonuclease/phosphatase family protein [Conservatibacter flavescens]PJG85187.1 hypothetical protein CVP05_07990 [Conservatibacter flavescens]
MRNRKLLLYPLFAFLALAIVFLHYSFEIYSEPKITLNSKYAKKYQPLVSTNEQLFCYAARFETPIIFPTEFNLLVWNLHKGIDKNWEDELDKLSHHTSLALLQEVSTKQNLPQRLATRFPYSLYASAYEFLSHQSGVNILSSYPPESYCVSSEEEPWIQIPKLGISSSYPLANGQSLLVVNLHMVNFEWHPTNYQQQLNEIITVISAHQGPLILAGDFNTWNKSRLALIKAVTHQHQLQEVHYENDVRTRFLTNPLDHVFVRGIEVLQADVIETDSSDHNPLLLKLSVQ